MLVAILKNKINNIDSYVHFEKKNDKYIYCGYNISNSGISLLSKDILVQIYDLIKMNNNCIYKKDYNGYKVYYDEANNFLHYIKNGKEDFKMFFLNNGVDAISYSARRLKTRKEIKRFELIDKGISVIMSLAMCSVIGLLQYALPYVITEIRYDTSKVLGLELDQISTKTASDYIENSKNIDDDLKKFLCNDEFLNDVISHYDDKMLYTANFRLKDISINDFNQWEYPGAAGSYNRLAMNCLNVLDTIEDESDYWYSILAHEYVHLMQADMELQYIMESSAELISSEYFEYDVDSYQESVSNLKLLVETVGPEVIWNLNFSSDDTTFDKILKKNLSDEEYLELISELSLSPFYDEPNHERIKALIEILYKNIYGIDMKDNSDIYNFYGNYIEKFAYFDQNNDFSIVGKYSFDEAEKIGLIKKGEIYRYEKEISADEYYNFYENGEDKNRFEGCCVKFEKTNKSYNYNGKNIHFQGFVYSDNKIDFSTGEGIGVSMSIKEALENGYIKDTKFYYTYNTIDPLNDKVKGMTKTEFHWSGIYPTVDNCDIDFDSKVITWRIPTIKERFKDQVIPPVVKEAFNVKLDILDISNGECVPGFKCYIKDSDNNMIAQFVTTNKPSLINLPVGNYTFGSLDSSTVTGYEPTLETVNFEVTDNDKLQTVYLYTAKERNYLTAIK